MAAYNYTALHANGKESHGVVEADSARQARQQLRDQGLTPIDVVAVTEQAKASKESSMLTSKKTMSTSDLSLFTRQFATLLTAGMPLEEALRAVAEQAEKPNVKSIILAIRSRVLEGHPLASGLGQFTRAFSPLYRATIASGEQSGHLDKVMHRLADYIEKQQQLTQKVQQALIYPAVMTTVSIAIVIFLLTFVVPKMVSVFTSSEQELPMMTSVLIHISSAFQHYGLYLVGLCIVFIVGFNYCLKHNLQLREQYHLFLLKLPLIGKSIKVVNTARFSRTLGILSGAGVPVLEAMTTASSLITNVPIQAAVKAAIVKVSEGSPIHRALKQTQYFPPMSLHLISTGESSGQLEAMLERAANTQEQEVERRVDILLSLFEPFLILTMGAIVLFIVLAVLLPIFSLNQIVG